MYYLAKFRLFAILGVIVLSSSIFSGCSDVVTKTMSGNNDKQISVEIEAKNAYVIDEESGAVLFSKNGDEKIAPASTTKLVTALTAMKYCDMSDVIEVGREVKLINANASRAWLYQGEELTVEQMLIAMLLPSGNDAAYSMAAYGGRKISGNNELGYQDAIQVFIEQMNKEASSLGANDSCFKNPDGFDCQGQYTTAHDMAIIGKNAIENEEIAKIAGMYQSDETWVSGETGSFLNTNEMIDPQSSCYNKNFTGLKTGTSDLAGYCVVSSFDVKGSSYISVVMGSTEEGRWDDSEKIFEAVE